MKRRFLLALCALSLSVWQLGCREYPIGSKERPFTMYFIPSVDAQVLASGAENLTQFVSEFVAKRLGQSEFHIKSSVPASYVAVVEAFGNKKADFAALTTFAYLLARDTKKYPVEALIMAVRGNNEHTYKAQFLAHVDSGIKTISDINGKRFAYTDPASTTGYLLPEKVLREHGVKPSQTVFAQKHDNVVTMIYQKQVDAGATYYGTPETVVENGKSVVKINDARARVLKQFPDVEKKVKIVGFTQEVPNEPWCIRSDLDPKLKEAIRDGLLEYAKTDKGKEIIKMLQTATGLVAVNDSDYDGMRKLIKESNLDIEAQFQKK